MFERKEEQLRCPKCKKYFVNVQAVNDVKEESKKKGCVYWLLFWWLEILKAPFTVFKRKKVVMKTRSYAVCQNCGYHWEIKQ